MALTSKYTAPDYLFQLITVTAGVLIALLIDGLMDWNNNRLLVAEARATIQREIADNKKDLDSTLSGFPRDRAAIDNAIKFATDMLTLKQTSIRSLQLHYNMADLSATGWRTAERTGALGHMDYGEVQLLSKLYDFQDLFVEQQRLIVSQVAGATAFLQGDFNPDKPNLKDLEMFRERVMQLAGSLQIQEDFAKRLAQNYDEALKR